MTRRLLENLTRWQRAAAAIPAVVEDLDPARREVAAMRANLDRLAADLRAERLAVAVNTWNLRSDPADWLPVAGRLPLGRVSGLACPWNATSRKVYSRSAAREECFYPSAFFKTIADGDEVSADVEHEPGKVFAHRNSGELTLWADPRGLWFKALLPDTEAGREAYAGIESGRLVGVSIAFDPNSVDHFVGGHVACICEAKLTGVALVHRPAYHETAGSLALENYPMRCETTRLFSSKLEGRGESDGGYIMAPSDEAAFRRRLVETRGGQRANPATAKLHAELDEALSGVWK